MVEITFDWDVRPLEWGGFNQEGIAKLVENLSEFYQITGDESEKILMRFGDHIKQLNSKENSTPPVAVQRPEMLDGKILQVATLNRSLELVKIYSEEVQIPVGAGGVCNGKILFTASDRGN
jgi:hypothetical protein